MLFFVFRASPTRKTQTALPGNRCLRFKPLTGEEKGPCFGTILAALLFRMIFAFASSAQKFRVTTRGMRYSLEGQDGIRREKWNEIFSQGIQIPFLAFAGHFGKRVGTGHWPTGNFVRNSAHNNGRPESRRRINETTGCLRHPRDEWKPARLRVR